MTKTRIIWRLVAVVASVFALALNSAMVACAAPPHPPTEEGEEGGNNLSVPAILVPGDDGSMFPTVTCSELVDFRDPAGEMGVDTNGDGVPDEHTDYYVQGVAQWQAECDPAGSGEIEVFAEWGDNLTNAPVKAGTPIRVEIGFLTITDYPMPGYNVVKLDPTLLDRESHYGTLGEKVDDFVEVRVWDSLVGLDIRNTDGLVVYSGEFTAEINSTGRIVYGYNWQQPQVGDYMITVVAPQIVISSADAGTVVDANIVTLDVTVGNKGRKGGGGKSGGSGGGGRPGDIVPGAGKGGRR